MLGIFHGIHAAWNEATRDAPETKNDIKESLSKKKLNKLFLELDIPNKAQTDANSPPFARS